MYGLYRIIFHFGILKSQKNGGENRCISQYILWISETVHGEMLKQNYF